MDAEQESELRARLEEGVELIDVFPHRYYKRRLYYQISVRYPKKNRFLVVVERKNTDLKEESIKLRIVEIVQLLNGERHSIDSSLIYAHMVLEPQKKVRYYSNPRTSKFNLNGKLHLPTQRETR